MTDRSRSLESSNHPSVSLTGLLNRWVAGDRGIEAEVVEAIYGVLHGLAARQLAGEARQHSLQPTALVHEAFLKLLKLDRIQLQSRQHFFALAATAIRRLAVSHARRHRAQKRGDGRDPVTLDEAMVGAAVASAKFLDLHDALSELKSIQPRSARLIELRYFAGLSLEEVADVTCVSRRTACRDWTFGRAWLYARLRRGPDAVEATATGLPPPRSHDR